MILCCARVSADTEKSLFVCDTRCRRMWQLNQLGALRHTMTTQERVCGCRDAGCADGKDPATRLVRDKDELPLFSPPDKQQCAGCAAEAPRHPCARCLETWFCSDDCARAHWPQHQDRRQQGAWCGQCGKEGQYVWCSDCNRVAYCSTECWEYDKATHASTCDGRWSTAVRRQEG